ncbi:pre-peptidase C-terminal domain-containing protein [Waterburya agarophytonicola K14]|uniref:Pre-peptidase C-terminal domain-containing protein n=1 Tax=Waterburya agarophytonicola KI4 TaxID=2874699 RepID=A0A964BQS8_9CYAN|nr:pre-peptidase C-terminal domain-containing protein [Waterburya agarophytonicola]MCC0177889.1 pre-peptidase C-terminal domain-containing protein [Waterburya agarophytonicola KI4]
MVKVYLPSFAIYTFSLTVNLLVLGIYPYGAIAQNSLPQTSNKQAANNTRISSNIEPEILSEINRVRTNPQGYANWLEDQRQYYDGIWLKLPGEKPIRTNKGLKALEEAIAILKEQQPLSPLNNSEQTAANATDKLEDFATANNLQNISYGRITPKGIVMSLVIDELFPDRRRRNSLLSPDAKNTGVACKPDPRYAKVCAIAYSDSTLDVTTEKPVTPPSPETETTVEKPPTSPSPPTETIAEKPPTPENVTTKPESTPEETETVAENLPQPPQPQAPPTPSEIPEVSLPNPETEIEAEKPPIEDNEEIEVARVEDEEPIATNSDGSRLLENVERGILEEGDRIIAEDGSFYDSYPLDVRSGESFTISLESEEFDAFVALIDAKGNIIEQNDDINEEDSNSRIRVTIPENGVYNVIVNAYDEGGKGEYILTISR